MSLIRGCISSSLWVDSYIYRKSSGGGALGLFILYISVPMKQVYVVENEHSAVKIGVSQNASDRIKVLSKQGGFKPASIYYTKLCSNGYEIENQVHKKLESYRIDGEWYRLSFDEAVKVVTKIFESNARLEEKKKKCFMPEDIERLFSMA